MLRTIKSAREIDVLFRDGDRVATPYVVVLVAPTPARRGRDGRVVFIAGKKLGSAVVRNRSRRVLREAVRQAGGPWSGRDVATIARPSTAGSGPEEVAAALRDALGTQGVGRP